MAEDKNTSATEAVDGENRTEASFRMATVILSVALILVIAVFLSVRYFERKNAVTPSVETFSVSTTASAVSSSEKLNINTATADELCTLPGIGSGRAEAIVEYRLEYGSFADIEEIMNVSGIGESVFSQIKDYICV